MKLHLWDGQSSRTFCGRGYSPRIANSLAKVRKVDKGILVEHCADNLPEIVCGTCLKVLTKKLGWGWWWKRVGGGKWLAMSLRPQKA